MKKSLLSFLLVAGTALAGQNALAADCQSDQQDPLGCAVMNGVSSLVNQMHRRVENMNAPMIVASAQNNDSLDQVCQHGRLIADMVSSFLTQKGYPVSEVRLANRLIVNPEGELLLSREVRNLAGQKTADIVVTSTWTSLPSNQTLIAYGPSGIQQVKTSTTYVTLKAVRVSDSLVLGSQTFPVPISTKGCTR